MAFLFVVRAVCRCGFFLFHYEEHHCHADRKRRNADNDRQTALGEGGCGGCGGDDSAAAIAGHGRGRAFCVLADIMAGVALIPCPALIRAGIIAFIANSLCPIPVRAGIMAGIANSPCPVLMRTGKFAVIAHVSCPAFMRAFRMALSTFAVFPIVNAGVHNSIETVFIISVARSGAIFINNTIISKSNAPFGSQGALHVDCTSKHV